MSGSASREHATSEYAETSSASQKRSRGVSVKRPSRSSAAAKATECTSRSRPPAKVSPTSPNTRSRSSSDRTSQAVTSGEPPEPARSRPPLAAAYGRGLAASGSRKLNTSNASARAYLAGLGRAQAAAAAEIRSAIPAARIENRYRIVLDGFALRLPYRDLPTLGRLAAVRK